MTYPGGTSGNEQPPESGYTYQNEGLNYPQAQQSPPLGQIPDQGGYSQYQPDQYQQQPVMMATAGGVRQPSGRGTIAVVLGAVMVMFLITTAVMTGLFIAKNSALTASRHTVNERDKTISTSNQEIDRIKKENQKLKDDLDSATTDLTGSQNQADELKRQKQVISRCIQLSGEVSIATKAGDNATAKAKIAEATPVCNEANRYLD